MNKTDLEQSCSAIVIIICDMKPLLYLGSPSALFYDSEGAKGTQLEFSLL